MYIIGEVKLHTVHLLGKMVTCYMRSCDACEICATAFISSVVPVSHFHFALVQLLPDLYILYTLYI